MRANKTRKDIRERRRQIIAQLMVRRPRVTQRQIRDALTRQGHTNPETDEPWSLGTINNDVDVIRRTARDRMRDDADTWRARELEMLRELQADAWDAEEYSTVVSISKRRAKLLGLDEPDELSHTMQLAQSEEYQAARSGIMQALEDFPEARKAVADALAGETQANRD